MVGHRSLRDLGPPYKPQILRLQIQVGPFSRHPPCQRLYRMRHGRSTEMMRRIVETEEPASRDASEHWGVATLWFVRIALPAGILLGGIALASLFRRSPPVEEASLPRPQEGVPFRQPASRPSGRGDVPPSSRRIESSANRPALKAPRSPSAVVLTPAARKRSAEPAEIVPLSGPAGGSPGCFRGFRPPGDRCSRPLDANA